MGVKGICKLWNDVFDVSLDEHLAPELDELVLSDRRTIYTDAYEFFRRTYLTESIINSLKNVVDVLTEKGGNNTFTIYSLFGGGKTHTLFAIYHAIRKPEILMHEDVIKGYDDIKKNEIRSLAEDIKKLNKPNIVVVYGKNYKLSGRPLSPIDTGSYKVCTIWGYIAHCLGKYDYVRKDDENVTVPDVDTIRKLLGDKLNIILIDEIVDYAHGLKGSEVERERNYVDKIPSFLDRLSTAVVGTKTVVIVTLPIEVRGKGIEKTETWYDINFVKNYWTALHRTGAKDFPALKIGTGELIDVLKKRNFELIDENKAELIIKDFERIYRQHKDEVFGRYEDTIERMRKTFPFHPDLIDILGDIIEKAGLQKTRDMLKLTRKILRNIWNKDEDPYMIMPWHFDITSDEFHAELFARRSDIYSSYSSVVKRDIIENTEKFDKPELARKISTVIFLKTYIYDSPTAQPHFPKTFDISKMVYEPEFFMKNNWLPVTIIDILEQIENKSYMYHLQIKDGKYWFWRIASVKEQIESEAKRIVEEERDAAENKIMEMVKKATTGETLTGKKSRSKRVSKDSGIKIFSEKDILITRHSEVIVKDDPSYKVVFLVNEKITKDDCSKIMFKCGDSERTYRNTVICVYPVSEGEYKKCMNYAAQVLACERIKKSLRELYPNVEEEVIKVQESIIDKIYAAAEDALFTQVLRTFRRVAYPSTEKGKVRSEVKVVDAPEGDTSLLGQIYLILIDSRVAKILDFDSFSFDSLNREVKEILKLSLEEEGIKKISEIKTWFKTNPAFPIVEEKAIERAIKEGVEKLHIGISDDEKIWYKKVYEKDVDLKEDEGNSPDLLKDDYKILPWKAAIQKQINKLLEEKKRAEESNVKITYELKYSGSFYPLEKIIGQRDWEEVVREGFIIKKVEKIRPPKKDFKIRIEPERMAVRQGETIEVKISVEPVGKDEIYMKIKPETGEVYPSEGQLPLHCVWKLTVPPGSGMKSIEVSFEGEDQIKKEYLILNIESEVISTREISENHIGMLLFEVTEIKDIELLRELNRLLQDKIKVTGNVRIKKEDEEISIDLKNVRGDVSEYTISQIKEVIGGEVLSADLKAYLLEELNLSELILHKIKPYSGKAEFKLKKKS